MNFTSILAAFYGEPLAILPDKMHAIRAFLDLKAKGGDVPEAEVAGIEAARKERGQRFLADIGAATRRPDGSQIVGRTALLPVFGVLSQRVGSLERASGGISTEEIGASLDSLMADRQVKTIVMIYDSPGGSVAGVQELADKIRAARDQKKIIGFADSMAASAGYWLMSQASETVVAPGGQVGSIGVITAHENISAMEEKLGVKTTLITSSPYKAEAHPFGPLTDEARAELQKKVDYYHAAFVKAVSQGRGVTEHRVSKDFGQGRMMTAQDAKTAGMVDRIGSMSDVLRWSGEGQAAETIEPTVAARHGQAKARAILAEIENSY